MVYGFCIFCRGFVDGLDGFLDECSDGDVDILVILYFDDDGKSVEVLFEDFFFFWLVELC